MAVFYLKATAAAPLRSRSDAGGPWNRCTRLGASCRGHEPARRPAAEADQPRHRPPVGAPGAAVLRAVRLPVGFAARGELDDHPRRTRRIARSSRRAAEL